VNVVVQEHDLSDVGDGAALAQRIATDGLAVHTLVNNAGAGTHGDFVTQDPGPHRQRCRFVAGNGMAARVSEQLCG